MEISVIILTWNSEDYIEKCISSLMSGFKERKFDYEIFIIDNGSRDNTSVIIGKFRDIYPDIIKPIYLMHNTGTTYSRNLALKMASGNFIVVMDSDIEITEGTIEHLIEALRKDKDAGLAVPKLIYPDGRIQKSTDNFPTILSKLIRSIFLKAIEKMESHLNQEIRVREVDYAISAMWVMKSELIVKVGLLDENIFYAPEDVDYCLRIWKSGYRVLYVPEVYTVHDAQEISRGIKINRATIEHIRGLYYLFCKHKYFIKKPVYH